MEAASVAPAAPAQAERCSPAFLRLAPDELLVGRVRSGSEEAFTALYERHYRSILSYCRHMLRSHEEGEDAVQQTFINAYLQRFGSAEGAPNDEHTDFDRCPAW